jgi:hypothetical protein
MDSEYRVDIFSQIPVFTRMIEYLNAIQLQKFMLITRGAYQIFQIPSYKEFMRNKIQAHRDYLHRLKYPPGGRGLMSLIEYGGQDIFLINGVSRSGDIIPYYIPPPSDPPKNTKIVNKKENAKLNRILQNQIFKKYRK